MALILLIGDNLGKLVLDVLGVPGLATKPLKRGGSVKDATALDKVTGRIRQEGQPTTENQGPGELDADGDAVGARVGAVLRRVHDNGREQDADGDAELVASDERASDLARALQVVWETN